MYTYSIDDKQAYFDLYRGPVFRYRYYLEWHLETSNKDRPQFTLPGICIACDYPVDFLIDRAYGARLVKEIWRPNWRERQVCPSCGLNSRQRFAVAFVSRLVKHHPRARPTVYMTEQLTPIYQRVTQLCPHIELIGSEYLGPGHATGTILNGVRHEDLENLSLADESVDLVVTNDVVEHVPHPEMAFAEIYRVLRRGAELFMTVPFSSESEQNVTRAEIIDGHLVHHRPETYHGNPLLGDDSPGSLVFTDFGWEILEQLRRAKFSYATLEVFWSYQFGHLGIPQEYFHARK